MKSTTDSTRRKTARIIEGKVSYCTRRPEKEREDFISTKKELIFSFYTHRQMNNHFSNNEFREIYHFYNWEKTGYDVYRKRKG